MRTLVTFLGRTARPEQGYPKVRYEFPDGRSESAAFVGFSLARCYPTDRLVIMGTAGSMWDQLLAADVEAQFDAAAAEAVMMAVESESVTQQQLDAIAPALSESLGQDVLLRIIPPALESDEQVDLLSELADVTEGSEEVSLDITHGYRHLPMLVVMAALYLRGVRPETRIRNIWYAALRQEPERATVHDLGGMLHIADWLAALQRSELTGDYGDVANLISNHDIAESLRVGGFMETVHQGQQARRHLQHVRNRLKESPLEGAGALFQPVLEARTEWVEGQQLYQRQRGHAMNALGRGDFLRAALYGFEAYVTKVVRQHAGPNADPNNHDTRKSAKEEYEANGPANNDWAAYKRLRDLRNVLAHGNRPGDPAVHVALRSTEAMHDELESSLAALLPESDSD